jgi:hypothetical protein
MQVQMEKERHSFSTLFLILTSLILTGCGGGDASQISKELDRAKGIGPLVLGDSLYPAFYNQLRSQDTPGTLEMTVLGSTLNPLQDFESPRRFILGQKIEGVEAQSIDGQISAYVVALGNLTPKNREDLRDSLSSRFGAPSMEKDSTVLFSAKFGIQVDSNRADEVEHSFPDVEAHLLEWRGERVFLRMLSKYPKEESGINFTRLLIFDRRLMKASETLLSQVDSVLQSRQVGSQKIEPLRSEETDHVNDLVADIRDQIGEKPLKVKRRSLGRPNLLSDLSVKERVEYHWYNSPRSIYVWEEGGETGVASYEIEQESPAGQKIYDDGHYLNRMNRGMRAWYSLSGKPFRPLLTHP